MVSGPTIFFNVTMVLIGTIFPSVFLTKIELKDSGSVRKSKSDCTYTRYCLPNRLKSEACTLAKYKRMVDIKLLMLTPNDLALTTSILTSYCGKVDLKLV